MTQTPSHTKKHDPGFIIPENARLNALLMDSLPHPAMLISKDRIVLAANKVARNMGVALGKYCWDTFGHCEFLNRDQKRRLKEIPDCDKHQIYCSFCRAGLLKGGVSQNEPKIEAFGKIWDTWWVPVEPDIFLHYAIDVTEKIRSERRLEESNTRLLKILDSLQAIVYVADAHTYDLLYMNQFSIEKFGQPDGKKCWQHIQDGQKGPCQFCEGKLLTKKQQNEQIIVWEHQNTRDHQWYQCRDLIIPWTDNRRARLHIATDITQNKLNQMQLEDMVRQRTLRLSREIEKRKQTEEALKEKGTFLQEANTALRSMLDHRHAERRAIEESIYMNIRQFIIPYLDELHDHPDDRVQVLINIIKSAIDQILTPDANTRFSKYLELTPTEVKVADLIKQGMQSKEIAAFLKIAKSSVDTHRNSIRKKFGLQNRRQNLRVFLNSLKK